MSEIHLNALFGSLIVDGDRIPYLVSTINVQEIPLITRTEEYEVRTDSLNRNVSIAISVRVSSLFALATVQAMKDLLATYSMIYDSHIELMRGDHTLIKVRFDGKLHVATHNKHGDLIIPALLGVAP